MSVIGFNEACRVPYLFRGPRHNESHMLMPTMKPAFQKVQCSLQDQAIRRGLSTF
ncbi:hypothetical protein C1H46_016002 [Malus baccata]|uniref:Uncharacterized protein n=1 Tax=Malus baccata TaxID=106549 RepID=A0A540MI22_MALBA|nr:hypothetical protein C1H46_016002 [Malus baccata]